MYCRVMNRHIADKTLQKVDQIVRILDDFAGAKERAGSGVWGTESAILVGRGTGYPGCRRPGRRVKYSFKVHMSEK